MQEAGGKCSKCRYDKNLKALHFHHLNPADKEHELGIGDLNKSLVKLRKEANKCILLCACCHAEEHDDDNLGSMV